MTTAKQAIKNWKQTVKKRSRAVTPPRVVIEVRGGNIEVVYSNRAVNVTVVDWDNIAYGSAEEVEAKKTMEEARKMKEVW